MARHTAERRPALAVTAMRTESTSAIQRQYSKQHLISACIAGHLIIASRYCIVMICPGFEGSRDFDLSLRADQLRREESPIAVLPLADSCRRFTARWEPQPRSSFPRALAESAQRRGCHHYYARGQETIFKLAWPCRRSLRRDSAGRRAGASDRQAWRNPAQAGPAVAPGNALAAAAVRRRNPRNKPVSGCVRRCASCRSPGRMGHNLPGGRRPREVCFFCAGLTPVGIAANSWRRWRCGPIWPGEIGCVWKGRQLRHAGLHPDAAGLPFPCSVEPRPSCCPHSAGDEIAVDAAGIGVFLVLHGRPAGDFLEAALTPIRSSLAGADYGLHEGAEPAYPDLTSLGPSGCWRMGQGGVGRLTDAQAECFLRRWGGGVRGHGKIRTAKLSQGEFTSPLSDNFRRKTL